MNNNDNSNNGRKLTKTTKDEQNYLQRQKSLNKNKENDYNLTNE